MMSISRTTETAHSQAVPQEGERERQVRKACQRRNLPDDISVEELLDFEYRRGAQLAVLVDDDQTRRHLIAKCRKAQDGHNN